ncbi:hypothetical protein P3S67_026142 [Capsicum chacoense]
MTILNEEKYVRSLRTVNNGMFSVRKTSISSRMSTIRRGIERGFDGTSGLIRKLLLIHSLSSSLRKVSGSSRNKILDPQEPFLQFWNKIFVLACIISVAIDPLFLYILVIDSKKKCIDLDHTLRIPISILRSVTDLFYVYHIVLQFRTGFIAPSSQVFGRGELIEDPYLIAKRYFSSYFFIDILAVLPLPQIVLFIITPNMNRPISLATKELLEIVILAQWIPRIYRMIPLNKEIIRTTGLFTETALAAAALILFQLMIVSNVVGAYLYLFTVERQYDCWFKVCNGIKNCVDSLWCGHQGEAYSQFLNSSCPLLKPESVKENDFEFGIFLDVLQSRVAEKRNFWSKLLYCFWWGLRNFSSLGQGLKTSNSEWEILLAILICIYGLFLFTSLIGNMQLNICSLSQLRVEGMRLRRQDAEQWMSHRMLPDNLRERIRSYEQYKWQQTRGVDEDYLISNLPKDLKRDIKRHLC